jgi:mRNA interferase MazF
MLRGEIWWASLRKPQDSEPGYRRPVLIIQSDVFNHSKIRTIMAAVITSNTRLAKAPGNVLLNRRQSGLPKPSVVNVSQIITLDKSHLTEHVNKIGPREMHAVEDGLRLVLSLQQPRSKS